MSLETKIKEISIKGDQINIVFATEVATMIAGAMSEILREHNAQSYVEMRFLDSDGELIILTAQRGDGKTPHEKRVEAEKALADLKHQFQSRMLLKRIEEQL